MGKVPFKEAGREQFLINLRRLEWFAPAQGASGSIVGVNHDDPSLEAFSVNVSWSLKQVDS
jgi:hypothetical protein